VDLNNGNKGVGSTRKYSLDIDVMVEYTKPDIARQNIITEIEKNIYLVIGTSGLTNEDYK
jgi:4-hydroxy-tetrahydrodipicolinate reductase